MCLIISNIGFTIFAFYILFALDKKRFIGEGFSILPKVFRVNSFGACPDDEQNPIRFNEKMIVTKAQKNKFFVNGEFIVSENITGPIQVSESMNNVLIGKLN